jgi:hypothetical protein
MYISLPLFADLASIPKNQARLLSQVVTSRDPNTNVGYISYEKTTPSQAQRIREDARELVALGYITKYPMTKASLQMKALHIEHSRRISFYMINPVHLHTKTVDREGLKSIWQMLR